MRGNDANLGLIPLTMKKVFVDIASLKEATNDLFNINISYIEVYNEQVNDLLAGR